MFTIKRPRKIKHSSGGKAILGVSLTTDFYQSKNDFFNTLRAIDQMELDELSILIADGCLYEKSLLSNNPDGNLSVIKSEAENAGMVIKKKFNMEEFIKNQVKTKTKILHWCDIVKSPEEFKKSNDMININKLMMEDSNNKNFSQSVKRMAASFVKRNSSSSKFKNSENSRSVLYSEQYICLELAGLFSYGKQNGIDYFIYPNKEFQPFNILRRHYYGNSILNWCSIVKSKHIHKNSNFFHLLNSNKVIKWNGKTDINHIDNDTTIIANAETLKILVKVMKKNQESNIISINNVNNKIDTLTNIAYLFVVLFTVSVAFFILKDKYSNNYGISDDIPRNNNFTSFNI